MLSSRGNGDTGDRSFQRQPPLTLYVQWGHVSAMASHIYGNPTACSAKQQENEKALNYCPYVRDRPVEQRVVSTKGRWCEKMCPRPDVIMKYNFIEFTFQVVLNLYLHFTPFPNTEIVQVMDRLTDTKNCRLRMHRECRERFPRHRFQRKPLVNDPGMHHGTCRGACRDR